MSPIRSFRLASCLVACALSSAVRALPQRFESVPTAEAPACTTIVESFSIVEERLVDRDGNRVGATTDAGMGAVRALVEHPDGTVYVAAENGVFVTAAGVTVADPLELRDGAPRGGAVGVHLDPAGVLWIATTEALGCVDVRGFFGRTFEAAELPAGPFLALTGDGDRLYLRTASGVHRYRTGELPRPTVAVRTVLGRPFVPGERLAADGTVPLELDVSGDGVLTVRYRKVGHHVWRAMPAAAPELPAAEPGNVSYEIVAFDRELRGSEPVSIDLSVPYPFYYDKRFLLGAAALGSLLIAGWFLWRARGRGRSAMVRAVASSILAIVIGLQILAGILRHGRSWPFVGFSMYTEQYEQGSLIYKMVLIGLFPDGSQKEIYPWRAGQASDGQQQRLVPLIYGGDEARAEFVAACNEFVHWEPIVGIRVLDTRHRLTADGPVPVAPIVLAHYEVPK